MISKFNGLQAVLSRLMADGRDYILVKHELKAGEKIGLHYHPHANEWVIAENGSFALTGTEAGKEKTVTIDLKPGEIIVVHFPPRTEHSLRAHADISYFVLRDRKDRTVYPQKA